MVPEAGASYFLIVIMSRSVEADSYIQVLRYVLDRNSIPTVRVLLSWELWSPAVEDDPAVQELVINLISEWVIANTIQVSQIYPCREAWVTFNYLEELFDKIFVQALAAGKLAIADHLYRRLRDAFDNDEDGAFEPETVMLMHSYLRAIVKYQAEGILGS